MKTTEANIEIARNGEELSSVSVIMPTWNKLEDDNTLSVNIPFFGIKTFAKDDADSCTAIHEAIKCFCIAAEKFGEGLEIELQAMGWDFESGDNNKSQLTYSIDNGNFVFEQILQTGEQYAETNLAIA